MSEISVKGHDYLNKLIHSENNDISLSSDITLDNEPVNIDVDNLTLDGNAHVIDANGKTQIFNITGDNITLKNIIFKNAYCKNSGGAISNFKGKLTLINCKFIDNISFKGDGGAINNWAGTLNCDNCDFINNSSKNNGGAIFNGNLMKITNSRFFHNDSKQLGRSIFNKSKSSLTLINSQFKSNDKLEKNYLNNEIFNKGMINVLKEENDYFKKYIKLGFLHCFSNDIKSPKYLEKLIINQNEISLDSDIEFEEEYTWITIEKDNLIIDGNGHTIDALSKNSIFKISSSNVTFKNINFKNSNSKHGALLVTEEGSLNLINCNFENNMAERGGAIDNYGIITVNNCNFENNISKTDFGGAINNNGEITLTKSNFKNNLSRNFGGAVNNANIIKLEGCHFESNIANYGAAINNISSGLSNIIKCSFIDNFAFKQGSVIVNESYANIKKSMFSNNLSYKNCHTIYQKGDEDTEMILEYCNFSQKLNNNSLICLEEGFCLVKSSKFDVEGEFHAIHNRNAKLRFEKSEFLNQNRNAIYNEGILLIKKEENIEKHILNSNTLNYIAEKLPDDWKGFTYLDSLIHSNSHYISLDYDIVMHEVEQDFYEGGIDIDIDNLIIDGNYHTIDANKLSRIFLISAKNVELRNIKFVNGKYFKNKFDDSTSGGGAIYTMPESNVIISRCYFLKNSSRNSAGSILNKSKYLKIDSITFKNNKSKNVSGVIINENSNVEIDNCEFIGNSANSSGALYNKNSSLKATNVLFRKNFAEKCGAIFNNCSSVELIDCKFNQNSSSNCGGALLNYKSSCSTLGARFVKNTSKQNGGAVFNEDGEIILKNSEFSNNSSNESGGCIFNTNGCLNILICNFRNNNALNRGGAVENNFNSKVYLTKSNFYSNSSNNGGAISNLKKCNLSIKQCHFENNQVMDNGGVIYNWYGFIDIFESDFRKNISENYAGAIDNYLGLINIKKSKFLDNNAKKHAGVIFNGGMIECLEDSIFKNNYSLLKGGAIYTTKSSSTNISKSVFDSNNAYGNGGLGGAIFNNSFNNGNEDFWLDIINCNFINNYANDDGAAIFNKGHLNIQKSYFESNINQSYGDILKNEGENVEVSIKNTEIVDVKKELKRVN